VLRPPWRGDQLPGENWTDQHKESTFIEDGSRTSIATSLASESATILRATLFDWFGQGRLNTEDTKNTKGCDECLFGPLCLGGYRFSEAVLDGRHRLCFCCKPLMHNCLCSVFVRPNNPQPQRI
jgi:hypothetical protein